jgi:ABC-type enterobactin transport system permease subunit
MAGYMYDNSESFGAVTVAASTAAVSNVLKLGTGPTDSDGNTIPADVQADRLTVDLLTTVATGTLTAIVQGAVDEAMTSPKVIGENVIDLSTDRKFHAVAISPAPYPYVRISLEGVAGSVEPVLHVYYGK